MTHPLWILHFAERDDGEAEYVVLTDRKPENPTDWASRNCTLRGVYEYEQTSGGFAALCLDEPLIKVR